MTRHQIIPVIIVDHLNNKLFRLVKWRRDPKLKVTALERAMDFYRLDTEQPDIADNSQKLLNVNVPPNCLNYRLECSERPFSLCSGISERKPIRSELC